VVADSSWLAGLSTTRFLHRFELDYYPLCYTLQRGRESKLYNSPHYRDHSLRKNKLFAYT
jgi:hypothetical protein